MILDSNPLLQRLWLSCTDEILSDRTHTIGSSSTSTSLAGSSTKAHASLRLLHLPLRLASLLVVADDQKRGVMDELSMETLLYVQQILQRVPLLEAFQLDVVDIRAPLVDDLSMTDGYQRGHRVRDMLYHQPEAITTDPYGRMIIAALTACTHLRHLSLISRPYRDDEGTPSTSAAAKRVSSAAPGTADKPSEKQRSVAASVGAAKKLVGVEKKKAAAVVPSICLETLIVRHKGGSHEDGSDRPWVAPGVLAHIISSFINDDRTVDKTSSIVANWLFTYLSMARTGYVSR
jgi:hypothetical protein